MLHPKPPNMIVLDEQYVVDLIAQVAKPRLMELLRLKIRHIYEVTPGAANGKLLVEGREVVFKAARSSQPYKGIERFISPQKMLDFVVNPGLLPIVKAIATEVRGREVLVTRRLPERAISAQLDHFGVRIELRFDVVRDESELIWEALYGVL